ncbi:MAG TPA: nicotinate (nicotinamide) nucleotide adenylyltransferase [Polyangiaceae bacterium]|jgi:nicotinate-nucleotide adenylyltransferase
MSQVALYGGSFDPPHIAHVLAAVYALKVGGFSRVLVVPVFEHAFQKQPSAFAHRVRMCELAMAGIEQVEVSTVEQGLATPSLTLRTVEHMVQAHPDWRLRLLIGSDVLGETGKWYAFERIAALAPPFIVARPGYPHPSENPALLPDVSSTRVREALQMRDEPSNRRLLAVSVPSAVLSYIEEHGLYRG